MRYNRSTHPARIVAAGNVLGVSLLAALLLTGCTVGTEPVPPAAVETPLTAPTTSASNAPDGIAPPDAAPEAALPDDIDPGSDAALAWEALLSPVGEYAAAASYQAVLDRFGPVEPYATILEGELRHIEALTRQLERYGVVVPDNPYLGQVVAPDDLQTAAQAWADGEVNNVALYDGLLAQVDDARLERVLGNLRRASLESHLPLFEAAAEAGGTLDELPAHTP